MLSLFPFDLIHVCFELRECIIRERSALNQYHQWCVPALAKICIIQNLCSPVSVNSEHLSYPPHFSIRHTAKSEINNLIRLIVNIDRLRIFLSDVFSSSLIHNSWISELLKVNCPAGYVLPELSELLLSHHSLALIEELCLDIRL